MNNAEKRLFLIKYLLSENPRYEGYKIPSDEAGQKDLLRSLFNVRPANDISEEFLSVQDEYLKEETAKKGITDINDLKEIKKDIYLWQGDITTLRCDAIVNAANSGMTGCWQPLHTCIDNCIHTYSGVELRILCGKMMESQGYPEPTGKAKVTPAFNLPCKYVIHTVGPIVGGRLENTHKEALASSYLSCLKAAAEKGCRSIAFCCISTGVFGFPQMEAAKIAVDTTTRYKEETGSDIKVIFNVFKDEDYIIYDNILSGENNG